MKRIYSVNYKTAYMDENTRTKHTIYRIYRLMQGEQKLHVIIN